MRNLGNLNFNQTLDFKFFTHTASGSLITLAGTPTLAVYKANNTVESTAGITLTVDFDARTGMHHVRILTTDAFYAIGNDYDIVITQGTVDGVSVAGYVIGHFSIENRIVEGIKKNTLLNNFEFLMVDSADGRTAKTGLTVTGSVSIDGAAFGSLTNSITEVANGVYKINLAAADLNGNVITLRFTAPGADARYITIKTSIG